MKRRDTLALGAALALPGLHSAAQAAQAQNTPAGQKVLRYAWPIAETGFDPAQVSDIYSRIVTAHIFEGLYAYDHLARPPKLVTSTAVDMPEVSDNFRQWVIKIKPGIFFADDPAFKGQKRELVAADYVYSIKRFADPAVKSQFWSSVNDWGVLGMAELRQAALDGKAPFNYDQPIEGLKALDRHTLQFKLSKPRPRFLDNLAVNDLWGAVAREVIEAYAGKTMEHPVGTGPFKLGQWRRSSLIVLDKNPTYRQVLWNAEPAENDAEGQAIVKRLKGKPLPLVDRVEISVIEEAQPRWLSFLNGQHDLIDRLPGEFINVAMPGGKVAPNLAKKGIKGQRTLVSDLVFTYFNMEDPVVGGMTPDRVALRRAISLGVDLDREIRLVRRGMGIPAQSPVVPNTKGYDPTYKSETSEYNPARAKALLEMFGYTDKNGDGWREQPNGEPLVLEYATSPDQTSRQLNELWQKNMDDLGIKIVFKAAKWPEQLKSARAGKLQMWGLASLAASSDAQEIFARFYGPQSALQNLARFKLPELDKIYDQMTVMPDGPERLALLDQAKKLVTAYMPYKLHCHRFVADMTWPNVLGYRRPVFWLNWYHMVDVLPGGDSPA
jgi:ABC-type transport system substrate-binding protein